MGCRINIYSVGCILHDFVGTLPRVPCNEIQDRGVFADIIRCCTRRDPSRRFQSVSDLRDAILEVSQGGISVGQPQVADYIKKLASTESLTMDEWAGIIEKIEDEVGTPDVRVLLGAISITRIQELVGLNPLLAARLGIAYAGWVKFGVFDFSVCDGLANRLLAFYVVDNIDCRVEVLLALLFMGVSHNRWYVEEKFFSACGPALDDAVARRFALEARILGGKMCEAISHLEWSIKVTRHNFHPVVASALNQICGVI